MLSVQRNWNLTKSLKAMAVFALMGIFISGCKKLPSEDLEVKGWESRFAVESIGNQKATCTAQFYSAEKNGAPIELTGNDQVYCNGQILNKELDAAGHFVYQATLSGPLKSYYAFVLRKNGERDYASQVYLANPITGISPGNNSGIQKGSALKVTWTKSPDTNDQMNVELQYEYQGKKQSFWAEGGKPETGVVFFAADKIPDLKNDEQVAATILLKRTKFGHLSPDLSGEIRSSIFVKFPITIK